MHCQLDISILHSFCNIIVHVVVFRKQMFTYSFLHVYIAVILFLAFQNDYDEPVHFECPNNGYLTGIHSIHNNHDEDRVWKFRCCHITGSTSIFVKPNLVFKEYDKKIEHKPSKYLKGFGLFSLI